MNTIAAGTDECQQASRTRSANVLTPTATVAAFPLGGIGTGNVSIGARGELRDWEISNHPDKGAWLPFTFFAIRAQPEGGASVTRVLESELQAPHEGDSGYCIGKVAGLPRLATSRMQGEYPLLRIDFDDEVLPVEVSLAAFTPLVPLDADDSGMPVAVLRYSVTNPGTVPVDVSVAGSMANPLAITSRNWDDYPQYAGMPTIDYRESESGLKGLVFGNELPEDDVLNGTAALLTRDPDVTATPEWVAGHWQDGVQLFWDDFSATGRLEPAAVFTYDTNYARADARKQRVGSISLSHRLAPGETRDFEFYLGWHTGNRSRAWHGMVGLPDTNADEVVLNHYAVRYPDAWAVVEDLVARLGHLESATRDFHRALFESSLPPELVDAVSSTLVVIRSTTCFRIDDGTPEGLFAAWEGSFDHRGSCEGTCTHVWNYAQTVAHLFPELERSARRTEFLQETLPDGRMRFRTNSIFGADPHEFHPAVDGQLGTIVRLYREWRFSGDDSFLRELWPNARVALEFAFTNWDADGDLVLDSQQHNTYDIEFYGENSMANSIFFAALLAGAAIADHLGETELAARYREAAATGAARMDQLLFNGEYYEQRAENVDAHRYQYGKGCLSDQLLGQTFAHLVGLGYVLPEEHVRSAVAAIHRHNFKAELHGFSSVQRTYALNDESGLILCSWPRGGRPRIPFPYSDEVWSGIEYQVATHLIFEGLVAEGLALVRAARARHDGTRRNPWNEVECGNHYARSMASWGVLVALTGVAWDGVARSLRFAPRSEVLDADGEARFFFSTAGAWGTVHLDPEGASVEVLHGRLEAESLAVDHPALGLLAADGPVTVAAGDRAILKPSRTLTEEE